MGISITNHLSPDGSYHQAVRRFSAPQVASRYPSEYRPRHWRDQREKQCVIQALRSIPPGSHILDLPCGTGRLTRLLISRGPVIISFFNTFALDAVYHRLVDIVQGRSPRDRIPIPYTLFHAELRSAGFQVLRKIAVR